MTAANLQYADVIIMAMIYSAVQTASVRQRIPFRAWLAFSLISVNSPYWKRSRLVENIFIRLSNVSEDITGNKHHSVVESVSRGY